MRISVSKAMLLIGASSLLFVGDNYASAQNIVLEGNSIKVGTSETGALGSGENNPPGIIFDETATGSFNSLYDYLIPGLAFEGFIVAYSTASGNAFEFSNNTKAMAVSLKIGDAINNSTSVDNRFPYTNFYQPSITDYSGISFGGKIYDNRSVAIGPTPPWASVVNDIYFNDNDKSIKIDTTITALRDIEYVTFTRALDPDAGALAGEPFATTNVFGDPASGILPTDLVYAESQLSRYMIGLYTESSVPHKTILTEARDFRLPVFDYQYSCFDLYCGDSPRLVNNRLVNDGIIGLSFDVGNMSSGDSVTLQYQYILGKNVNDFSVYKSKSDIDNLKAFHLSSNLNDGTLNAVFKGGVLKINEADANYSNNFLINSEGGTVDTNGLNSTFSGILSGTGGLIKTGVGTLTLTGANSYTGGTLVSGGRLAGDANSLQGAITNNAEVEFNQATAGTYTGVMSGTGGLIKTGVGTLTLTGANSYTGGTLVNGGRLAGDTNSLQGNITNDAEVEFNQATAGTYTGVMSGTGGLIKTGVGTLTLTGANSYTGGTLVNGGRLAGDTNSLQGNITNDAEVEFNQATAGTYTGVMSGTGGLIKTGVGTLTLTGANSYTGGTLVNGGRLAGDTNSLQGNITNDAEVEFNQATAGTYTGAMTGTGGLIKSGTGTLTLTGANSYTGGTLVSGGRLAGDANSLQGAITNNAEVEFNQATAGTYAGAMTGTGGLIKTGTGTLTLTGANSYTGGTSLNEGTITVSNAAALGTGTLSMSEGTTLAAGANGLVLSNDISLKTKATIDTGANTFTLSGLISDFTSQAFPYVGSWQVDQGPSWSGSPPNGPLAYTGQEAAALLFGGNPSDYQISTAGIDPANINRQSWYSIIGYGTNAFAQDYASKYLGLYYGPTSGYGSTINEAASAYVRDNALGVGFTNYAFGVANVTLPGQLVKIGTGTLILQGGNTYTGGTLLNAATIQVNGNQALGTGGLFMANGTTLRSGGAALELANTINISGTGTVDTDGQLLTLNGVIADEAGAVGSLTKIGSGTLVLTGANTYTGGTLVSAGRLAGNTTSLQGAITNNAEVEFNQATAGAYSGAMTGTGGLIKTGTGTLTLTGANSYTGGTLVSAGRLAGNTTSLQGAITNNAEVEFNQATAGTYAGAMTGTGGLIKTGAGTLTLTGANTYTGGTLVSAGRLTGNSSSLQGAIANNAEVEFNQATAGTYAGAMSGTGGLIKTGTGTLTLTGANTYTGGTLVSAGRLAGNTTSLQGNIANNAQVEFNQATAGTYSGAMTGTGGLIKTGVGTLTLTGANSYTGGTLVSAGRLAGNTTSLQGAITNNAEVEFNQATAGTYAGVMSGTGGLIKTGTGTLTLTGANSYTGGTLVSAGRLAGNTTSLQGAITNNAEVEFNQATAGTYAGVMSGTGGLIKTGTGTLTLTGANTYTGGTLVSVGRLAGNTTSLQGAIANNAEVEFNQATAGTYAGAMTGTGQFIKTGTGTLTLTGANTYTGGTLVSAGRLAGNTTSLQGAIANNAEVEFNQATAGTYAGVMSGTGGLIKTGTGTLTLTGANSYTGGTLVSAGRLAGDTNSLQGTIINNAEVEFNQATAGIYAGTMAGTGALIKTGNGALTLTGANSYSGGTLVSAGRLAGNSSSLQGAIANNAEVEFNQATAGTYTGAMSGTGQFIKTGAGTLTLTGANSYTGGTLVSGGRLAGDTNSLQGAITNDAEVEFNQATAGTYAGAMTGTGQFIKTGAGTLTLTGANSYTGGTLVSAGRLAGDTNSLQGTIINNAEVEFNQATAGIYAGTMAGTGALIKTGNGALTLTGANSYSGGTLVSAGRLAGNSSSLQGAIANNAEVEFNQATAGTYTGAMSGTGQFIKTGAGTLTLTGANSYTGGTLVSGGRLAGDTNSLQGAITNDAEVEFNQATAGTYAGAMSGTGGLIKTGTGTLTLTGANSYTGGTLVSSGRLIGNSISLKGNIANNAQVEFNQAAAGTYSGVMTGTGGLIKTGTGTLTLTGANSYTGGTLVAAGRLAGDTNSLQGTIINNAEVEFNQATAGTYAGVMAGTGALIKTGTGTLTLAGNNSYTGGTLVVAGRLTGNSSSLQGNIANNAQVEFNQATAGTYAGVMSGTGSLIKTGASTLTLTGANSYTGGTVVAAGRLTGNSSSLQGNIANNAQVEFNQTAAGAYAGTMTGTGALIKTGTGTLTLTGANSYTGGTLVAAGRLAGDANSLQGNIANDAEVEFNQTADGTYAGNMGGTGGLIKTGAGMLTLTGINTISGNAFVQAGTLNVSRQLATGGLFVRNGATLSGTGVIGGNVTIENGGTLSPGNSPGTLSVVGNVVFASGATFIPEIDGRTYSNTGGAGSYDVLAVSGNVTLGGTIAPRLRGIFGTATNSFTPTLGDTFAFISANNITGSFSSVAQPIGLASNTRFDLLYSANSVRLAVTPANFRNLGVSENWRLNSLNAAAGLDAVRPAAGIRSGDSQSVFNGLYGMNAPQLANAFGQLSGEIYANALQSQIQADNAAFTAVMAASCVDNCYTRDGTSGPKMWAEYIGNFSEPVSDSQSTGFDSTTQGLAVGATVVSTENVRFGVALSYLENSVDSELGATSRANSISGYGYVHYLASPRLTISGGFALSLTDTNISRSISSVNGTVDTSSKKQSSGIRLNANVSYRLFGTETLGIWSDTGVTLTDAATGRTRENTLNQDYALLIDETKHQTAQTYLGSRAELRRNNFHIGASVGWMHDIGDNPAVTRNVMLGNARWKVASIDTSRNGYHLGAKAGLRLTPRMTLFGSFDYLGKGNGYSQESASGGVKISF